jgi:hypothetical protein
MQVGIGACGGVAISINMAVMEDCILFEPLPAPCYIVD